MRTARSKKYAATVSSASNRGCVLATSFEYTSGAVLETAVGTMKGSYRMVADDGTHFDAPIPAFVLSIPRTLH